MEALAIRCFVLTTLLGFAPTAGLCAQASSEPGTASEEPAVPSVEDAAAAALLEKAEALAERGSYSAAQAAYRKLVQRYPRTAAGAVAQRRSGANAFLGASELGRPAPASGRVDVVILGDGYTLEHQRSFDRLARIVPRVFERNRTLGEYFDYFRFVRANVVSAEDGIDGLGREADTAMGAFLRDEKRGHIDVDHGKVAAMCNELGEHDRLAIVYVRAGEFGFGSHGVAVVGGRDEKQTLHEWGHAFANLGEEHTDPERPCVRTENPPNLARSADPKTVPWKHWLEAGTRGVGVYQGGDGKLQGVWKPMAAGCVMDQGEFFCPPCREAIVLRIYDFVDPICGTGPEAHESSETREPKPTAADAILIESRTDFEVTVMTPKSHGLEVAWWLFPASEAPAVMGQRGFRGPRSERGPLAALAGEPVLVDSKRCAVRRFVLDPRRCEPGRYKLVCVVRDDTQLRGEAQPWVLNDARGVLESRRAWWVEIVEDPR